MLVTVYCFLPLAGLIAWTHVRPWGVLHRSLFLVPQSSNPSKYHSRVCTAWYPPESGHSFLSTVCGILGLLLHDPNIDAAQEINEGLSLLQHRGQDACGIVTCGPKGRFYQCKANGMVRDVFDKNAISRLIGGMGVGHGMQHKIFLDSSAYLPHSWVRYPTAGSSNNAEAQPFYVNSPYGIVFAHVRL